MPYLVKHYFYAAAIVLLVAGGALAGRPLITDDAYTVGRGNYQLEAGLDYSRDDTVGQDADRWAFGMELTYGILDNLDIVLGSAYAKYRINNCGTTTWPEGITDTLLEFKWCLYTTQDDFSLAMNHPAASSGVSEQP